MARTWSNGSFVRTAAALLVGAFITLVASGGAGAATTPNTFTGCLLHGQMVHVRVGLAPGRPCAPGKQVSWNETAQQTQTDVAALSTRADTLSADLQNEAQTREAVDSSFSNTFQATASALNGETLDALQADLQTQITATHNGMDQETDPKLLAMMQQMSRMQQTMSNILKQVQDTQAALTSNDKG